MRHHNVSALGYDINAAGSVRVKKPRYKTLRGAKKAAFDRASALNDPTFVYQEGIGGKWYQVGFYAPSSRHASVVWFNT